MARKEKAPCTTHPDRKRYSNGACSGCVGEAKKERYNANPEKYRAYAREYEKRYQRRPLTEAEKAEVNARRREKRAQQKRNAA